MNINMVVKRFASGELERSELEEIYKGIGYSAHLVDVLMQAADCKKAQVQYDEANGIDPSRFQVAISDCISQCHSPSGSLGEETEKGSTV